MATVEEHKFTSSENIKISGKNFLLFLNADKKQEKPSKTSSTVRVVWALTGFDVLLDMVGGKVGYCLNTVDPQTQIQTQRHVLPTELADALSDDQKIEMRKATDELQFHVLADDQGFKGVWEYVWRIAHDAKVGMPKLQKE